MRTTSLVYLCFVAPPSLHSSLIDNTTQKAVFRQLKFNICVALVAVVLQATHMQGASQAEISFKLSLLLTLNVLPVQESYFLKHIMEALCRQSELPREKKSGYQEKRS